MLAIYFRQRYQVRRIALDLGNLMTPEGRVFEHPPFGNREKVVLIPMAANQKNKVVLLFVVIHCHGDTSCSYAETRALHV